MKLRLIGYWSGEGADDWPDPRRFVDEDWWRASATRMAIASVDGDGTE